MEQLTTEAVSQAVAKLHETADELESGLHMVGTAKDLRQIADLLRTPKCQ